MRNIGILIVLALWILLGVKMCSDWNQCCKDAEGTSEISEAVMSPATTATSEIPDVPIYFSKNSFNPVLGSDFEELRDSLVDIVGANQKLRLVGIYGNSEDHTSSLANLGLARADAIKKLFAEFLVDGQLEIGAQRTVGQVGDAEGNILNPIIFSVVDEDTETIPSGTLIYFPTNSTNRIQDASIDQYLDKVAERVKESGEKIRLVGHTDNVGTIASNIVLGRQRAEVIRDYLLGKGVPASSISVDSRGESNPVANNSNERGRAQNRRAELQIIQ